MGCQFKEIYTQDHVDGILDELHQNVETDIDLTKSDLTRAVLELGYRKALNDINSRLTSDKTLFVDKCDIKDCYGRPPYEDPSITQCKVYKTGPDILDEELFESEKEPDEIYILCNGEIRKYKLCKE